MTTKRDDTPTIDERSQPRDDLQQLEGKESVLRWGGLAGILGSLLLIFVFAIVIVFIGPDPVRIEEPIRQFPDVRAARTVENSIYLVVLILWVLHYLALYHALQRTSFAPALFGSVLGILGLGVLATGALLHVAQARLSNLYHAPGATPQDQETLVLLWQATQGIFDALLVTGLVILPISLLALGIVAFRAPAFGKGYGGMSMALGVMGLVAATVILVDPGSPIAIVGILSLIVFHLVLGRKVHKLSRACNRGP